LKPFKFCLETSMLKLILHTTWVSMSVRVFMSVFTDMSAKSPISHNDQRKRFSKSAKIYLGNKWFDIVLICSPIISSLMEYFKWFNLGKTLTNEEVKRAYIKFDSHNHIITRTVRNKCHFFSGSRGGGFYFIRSHFDASFFSVEQTDIRTLDVYQKHEKCKKKKKSMVREQLRFVFAPFFLIWSN